MKRAMIPGTFNPIHKGHIKLVEKAAKLFDEILVVITFNNEKNSNNDIDERLPEVKKALQHLNNVEVMINKKKMTAELAQEFNISYLVRSARNDTDFKYELELAAGNHSLNKSLETILIAPDYSDIKYESRLLRQRGKK